MWLLTALNAPAGERPSAYLLRPDASADPGPLGSQVPEGSRSVLWLPGLTSPGADVSLNCTHQSRWWVLNRCKLNHSPFQSCYTPSSDLSATQIHAPWLRRVPRGGPFFSSDTPLVHSDTAFDAVIKRSIICS